MSEVHAIIGLQTLTHLDEVLEWKEKVYNYYKEHLPGIFQKIPYQSNYNTIGFLNEENLKIPSHIEYRKYYDPIFEQELYPNTDYVFSKIICLPSYYNCPYEQIVEDIKEANEL